LRKFVILRVKGIFEDQGGAEGVMGASATISQLKTAQSELELAYDDALMTDEANGGKTSVLGADAIGQGQSISDAGSSISGGNVPGLDSIDTASPTAIASLLSAVNAKLTAAEAADPTANGFSDTDAGKLTITPDNGLTVPSSVTAVEPRPGTYSHGIGGSTAATGSYPLAA
jgi:hypothetical protein